MMVTHTLAYRLQQLQQFVETVTTGTSKVIQGKAKRRTQYAQCSFPKLRRRHITTDVLDHVEFENNKALVKELQQQLSKELHVTWITLKQMIVFVLENNSMTRLETEIRQIRPGDETVADYLQKFMDYIEILALKMDEVTACEILPPRLPKIVEGTIGFQSPGCQQKTINYGTQESHQRCDSITRYNHI